MHRFAIIFTLAAVAICCTSCVSSSALMEKAHPPDKWDEKTKTVTKSPSKPLYYAALPFTIAFDVVAFPFFLPNLISYVKAGC